MGLFGKSKSSSDDVKALRAADAALNANTDRERAAGIHHETPEYHRLNSAANEAASKVSRWRGGTK